MIVPARRRVPRTVNYRRGVWSGLGAWNPPTFVANPENCSPLDTACVLRNAANANAYDAAMQQAQANNNYDQCMANAGNANSQEQYDAVVAACGGQLAQQSAPQQPQVQYAVPASGGTSVYPVNAPVMRGGQLTFSTSRGGTSLYVGDTWTIQISGATPNAAVTVSGQQPGNSFTGVAMGNTDSNGNFSKSGTVGTGEIGSWFEKWYVGGAMSGSLSFTVAAAPTTPAGQTIISSSGAQTAPGSTATAGAPSTPSTPGTVIAGFDLSTIPLWGWLAAGGVAIFAFGGQRGR